MGHHLRILQVNYDLYFFVGDPSSLSSSSIRITAISVFSVVNYQPMKLNGQRITESCSQFSASIKHFRSQLVVRQFTEYTDHKQAYHFRLYSFVCQLDFISQFKTYINYVSAIENTPADTLLRIVTIHLQKSINHSELAKSQIDDPELQKILSKE